MFTSLVLASPGIDGSKGREKESLQTAKTKPQSEPSAPKASPEDVKRLDNIREGRGGQGKRDM